MPSGHRVSAGRARRVLFRSLPPIALFRRIISAVLGDAGRAAPAQPSADRFPEPVDFIGLLKHQMAANLQNITPSRAIVPGHYTILLHSDAHHRLQPLFKEICKAAAEELTREAERLSKIPFGYQPDAKRKGPIPEANREVYPLDYTWSIELRPVLYAPDGSDIPKGYMAVATDMINHRGAEVLDDGDAEATKMTVKNPFSGVFEEQFVQKGSLSQTSSSDSVTVEVPYPRRGAAPAPAAPVRKNYSLIYRHPVTQQSFTHRITKPITTIGRVTDTNADVDLRIAVDVQVSEEHAKLRLDAASGRIEILDVSSYGTTVDGQPVPPSNPARHNENWTPVPEGAEIGLAGYVFLTLRADPA